MANDSDWRFLLGSSIYSSFLPSIKSSFTLDALVRIYVAITLSESEEQGELMFRIYATFPPEYDEVLKEQYVFASRMQRIGMKKIGLMESQVTEFARIQKYKTDIKIYKCKLTSTLIPIAEFMRIFREQRQGPMFNWIDRFNQCFEGIYNAQEIPAEKPELTLLRQPSEEFTPAENQALKKFFDNKI